MGQDQSRGNVSQPTSLQKSPPKPKHKKRKAKLQDIVVVSERPDGVRKDSTGHAVDQLRKMELTVPIIPNMSGITTQGLELLPAFSAEHVTEMLLRFQYHLRECASAVAFDQNAISRRVRDIELYSTSVMKRVSDHQRRLDTAAMNLQKVDDIGNFIPRIEANARRISELMNDLNDILPEEDRLPSLEL